MEYKICNNNDIVAEIVVYKFGGDSTWMYNTRTAHGKLDSYDNYIKLCEYDYINHKIVGEETRTYNIDKDVVSNKVVPLVQTDKNGIGRDWCFLSAMGMVINVFEGTEYNTNDIADMYLNKFEINRNIINDSGYISNSKNYEGNTARNIRYALEYRGIKTSSTADLTFDRAKESINRDGTALLVFKRMYRDINNDNTINDYTYEMGSDYDKIINRHAVVIYGYNANTKDIIIADPSPRENTPGPYTPDIVELWYQNGKYYIPPRGKEVLNGKEVYKVYMLDTTYFYDRNIFDTKDIPIEGQGIKQLSSYACIASIINKVEGLDKTAEEIARQLLPQKVVDNMLINDTDIFKKYYGRSLNTEFIKVILSLRGYNVSDNLGYKTISCKYIQDNLDLNIGIGIIFRVQDMNNNEVGTHFALIDSVDTSKNMLKIMDPSGVGSYRLINKNDTVFDASFYGHGYTMRADGIYKYSLELEN